MRSHTRLVVEQGARVTLDLTSEEFNTLLLLADAGRSALRVDLLPSNTCFHDAVTAADVVGLHKELREVYRDLRARGYDRVPTTSSVVSS